ncbi:M23 family metallopeptidase [Magnetofaba australis]|uniref:Putative peptidase M23B n=1 Tax=Magnetofaba australis IT-1 TaxID=1434232 RepID=A0A1Y2K7H8_9PROT|nr:M23 family metallopeptidase [Magnetofaba australis]OSM05318.1 putative peptidase M23B [Magnetofaba australis IT-1]
MLRPIRLLPALLCIAALNLLLTPFSARAAEMILSGELIPGSAVLLQVEGYPDGSKLSGTLAGKSFPFTAEGAAILALDMETKPGPVTLKVNIQRPDGQVETLRERLSVPKRDYKTERIDGLPKKKVELNPADLKRATIETRAIKQTYNSRGGRPGFLLGFQMPVTGRFSGIFGSRRVLNGKPRRPHNGVDIAAPQGTPIVSIAPGEVKLAGDDYFFTGNTVVVHHGHGVTSLYSHMNKILVKPGQWVGAGEQIGEIGMTGRATGPHLHWGVMVRHARVDPLLLPGIRDSVTP